MLPLAAPLPLTWDYHQEGIAAEFSNHFVMAYNIWHVGYAILLQGVEDGNFFWFSFFIQGSTSFFLPRCPENPSVFLEVRQSPTGESISKVLISMLTNFTFC